MDDSSGAWKGGKGRKERGKGAITLHVGQAHAIYALRWRSLPNQTYRQNMDIVR